MSKDINILKQEKKPRVVIGLARTYNHEALLSWLSSIGLTIEEFVEKFNYRTRTTLLASAPEGIVAEMVPFKNITPTVGFAVLTKFLSGNGVSPDEMEVMVHAFGDDDTTPADGDTALGNETERKLLSSKSYSGASAFYTAFYALSEGNGTHAEMGLFMNADPMVADDGTLWDRSLIDLTKLDTQSLTIDYEDTFVNNE
jgi:hypothetical protein